MSGDERPWVLIDFDGVLNINPAWEPREWLLSLGAAAGEGRAS
ncbi:MAG: hypothetical protein JWM19_919 [Actinomycetia bacterium]|nr:hypothetical protein [Actinomycetes bacterium]